MNEYKAGDTVVVRCGGWCNDYVRIGTVEAVTPTGQIRLADKSRCCNEHRRVSYLRRAANP